MDLSEVIADAIRREIDVRRVYRELMRQVDGTPFYTWEDANGVKRGGAEPPPDAVNLRAEFPTNKERAAAAKALVDALQPKQLHHRHEVVGAPQRTPMDTWLDGLSAADMDKMFGSPPPADDVEIERVEDTLPPDPNDPEG